MSGKIAYPRSIDRSAKSLIKKLLIDDLTKRYGCMKEGAVDIKKHKWFMGLDFELLLQRKYPSPFIPEVSKFLTLTSIVIEFFVLDQRQR